MPAHRLLAERALRAEIGNADVLLERAAGGDDFAEHGDRAFRRQDAALG